jgi:hypothetical protein
MRYVRFDNFQKSRPSNPFAKLLGLIVGIVVFAAAVLLGGIMLAAIIGFFLIAGVILYVRVWWLTRKAGLSRREGHREGRQKGRREGRREGSFVEAEYQVVEPSRPEDDRH